MNRLPIRPLALITLLLCCSSPLSAQLDIESAPIRYSETTPSDRVNRLQEELEKGRKQLLWDSEHGWLPSLLKALEVPTSSQTLVFSKTSMQFRRISPERPRAIYFNEDVYVGWVQRGEVIELSAVDAELGAVFYTIDQDESKPVIKRDKYGECLACHHNGRTQQVPGFVVRSLYVLNDGQPELRLGSTTVDHTTPFEKRFGGWYVTGEHGDMVHLGNLLVPDETADSNQIVSVAKRRRLGNASQLPSRVNADRYLEPSSDVVALMLLEHQTQFHNAVTKAAFVARRAIHQQTQMNRILERSEDYQSESTLRRLDNVVSDLVDYTLFVGEAKLTSKVVGRDDFRAWFQAQGPRLPDGRSLRELDLTSRLLRYPCSYLIYSPAVLALPKPIQTRYRDQLLSILTGTANSKKYGHLSATTRNDILAILRATHPFFE